MIKLNKEQAEAVRLIEAPLLVLAGAGSGKTRVITEKIKHLVKDHLFDPSTIYAVTFTNKAAREMAERLQQAIGKPASRKVHISTFHTLGLSILKRHGTYLNVNKGFSIYDQKDAFHLMESLVAEDSDVAKLVLAQISHWKNDRLLPEEALSHAKSEFEQQSALLYQRYQEQLLAYNAVDFDDLILMPLRLLQEHNEVRAYWQKKIHYLLVDEYQDTNLCQYDLITLLMEGNNNFTVVGDDDQSIYAWRGARPENLKQLWEDFPNLTLVKLEQNYRSTSNILKAANHVIAKNPHLYEKQLWSSLGAGDLIEINDLKSAQEEAEFVAVSIVQMALMKAAPYSDFAVLYRGNHQARIFEMALRMRGIPTHVVGGMSFFQQPEVKDLLSYLKLIANPEDGASLLRIINIPKREIGAISLKKITDFAVMHHLTLFETLIHPHLGDYAGKAVAYKCAIFHGIIMKCQQKDADVTGLFDMLLALIDYESYLRGQSTSSKAFERRMRNIELLAEWFTGQQRSLSEILSHLTLIAILENESDTQEKEAVTLMTLHSAKGLEFPHVFMVGLEEDILPHRNSIDNNMIEEERRLFYVGITRAQHRLNITYCRQRQRYGEWETCKPSRFLSELPPENVLWKQKNKETDEEKRENTTNTIKELQAMLKKMS